MSVSGGSTVVTSELRRSAGKETFGTVTTHLVSTIGKSAPGSHVPSQNPSEKDLHLKDLLIYILFMFDRTGLTTVTFATTDEGVIPETSRLKIPFSTF